MLSVLSSVFRLCGTLRSEIPENLPRTNKRPKSFRRKSFTLLLGWLFSWENAKASMGRPATEACMNYARFRVRTNNIAVKKARARKREFERENLSSPDNENDSQWSKKLSRRFFIPLEIIVLTIEIEKWIVDRIIINSLRSTLMLHHAFIVKVTRQILYSFDFIPRIVHQRHASRGTHCYDTNYSIFLRIPQTIVYNAFCCICT